MPRGVAHRISAFRFINKIVYSALFIMLLVCGFLLVLKDNSVATISAQSIGGDYSLETLDVDININEDSSIVITETAEYRVESAYLNGFKRDITLTDFTSKQTCLEVVTAVCGGFDLIDILKVEMDGREFNEDEYFTQTVFAGSEERLSVRARFIPEQTEPIQVDDQMFRFTVSYEVWGALAFFDDHALFYWDTIFPDRDFDIDTANVVINYPGAVEIDSENMRVETSNRDYTVAQVSNSEVVYKVQNIKPFVDFTVLQKIPLEFVEEPGVISLATEDSIDELQIDNFDLDSVDIYANTTRQFYGIPAGAQVLTVPGNWRIEDKQVEFSLASEEVVNIELQNTLTPTGRAVLMLQISLNVLLCLIALAVPVFAIFIWWLRGRDIGKIQTIVPKFSPPAELNVLTYSALATERVQPQVLSAGIVELATKGHLKITELSRRNYRLTKTIQEGKFSQLDKLEQELINKLFGGSKKKVTTKHLQYKFADDYQSLRNSIYRELREKKLFTNRPDKVRNGWLGAGMGIGFPVIVFGFFAFSTGIYTLGILGLSIIASLGAISFIMPAKTALGSRLAADVEGFKMYLRTAEKYRLQDLTPETFERYLGAAVALGVEKQWARNFKDIYKAAPDWYEGRFGTDFSPILFANSLNSFSNTTSRSLVATQSSSGSSTGGGWSGGGGFSGGFSGGGGGGGGGGGW